MTDRESFSSIAAAAIGFVIGSECARFLRDAYVDSGFLTRYGPAPIYAMWVLIVAFCTYLGFRVVRRDWARGGGEASVTLLDTSAIIDGRVVDVVASGFLAGPLVVPRFVLAELQLLADAGDAARRARGKRGLDVLERLRHASPTLQIVEFRVNDGDVDTKLVTLACRLHAKILTTDFNLNRVAKLQGVDALNINELANAVKAVALPGEEMAVSIIKDGTEQDQGVGFLEDGTMVVVENGRERKGEQVGVQVTSVLQTSAGRMIFAKIKR